MLFAARKWRHNRRHIGHGNTSSGSSMPTPPSLLTTLVAIGPIFPELLSELLIGDYSAIFHPG
jgi:hypothetical protein